MVNSSAFSIIVPLVKAKYKNAAHGSYIHQNGKLYFKSGNDVVYIREYFSQSGATPEKLIENTVCFESQNSTYALEKQDRTCYHNRVNDVL